MCVCTHVSVRVCTRLPYNGSSSNKAIMVEETLLYVLWETRTRILKVALFMIKKKLKATQTFNGGEVVKQIAVSLYNRLLNKMKMNEPKCYTSK